VNRLWVRFALVIAGVILLITLLPLVYVVAVMQEIIPAPVAFQKMAELEAQLPPELQEQFAVRIETFVGESVVQSLILAAVVGILAGAWLSHLLARPLQALERGAQAVAGQNLAHRVAVRGSREIQTVALAFNQMAAQLEQAEGLRRNLLADVAHELRNPLHILQGNLQAILDGVYPLEEGEISRLLEQARHLARLTDDLHLLAQAEARQLPLQRAEVDVAALVKETAAAFKPLAATKKIQLQVELLGSLSPLSVDAARIRQVVHNLLANALSHTPENGRILVRVIEQGDTLLIQIIDSGPGIATEQLPFVFDRFYRTDMARSREMGGAGLGLAIVKAITEAHGGRVQVERGNQYVSGDQPGSMFTIYLPLA
jgi:signal transduction histidine kinase